MVERQLIVLCGIAPGKEPIYVPSAKLRKAGDIQKGNRNPEPKKPDFPSELSPDSSPQSKTDKGGAAAPTFRWKGLEGADGYVVLVSQNENFENIEWSARTRETAVVYPSNAKPLDKGKHFWRVLAVNEEDKPMEDKKGAQTFFEVK